jgi:hypothetical protein
MNHTDERLRAAARTAADMFPPGGDVPPLRLPERVSSGRMRSSAAARAAMDGRRRMRAWLAPLAAAAAVIAVIAALVVPHQIGGNAGHREHLQPGATAPSSAAQHEQHKFDALVLDWAVPATGLQYDRGGKLLWMLHGQYLRASARCMAGLGYHISARQPPYNLADFADNSQMPDLPRIARTHEFVGGTGGLITPSYTRAEQRALDTRCKAPTAAYQPLLGADSAINNAWWRIISRAQGSSLAKAAIPALQACATRYGYPNDPYGNATGPIKNFSDFMNWVAGFLDGADSRGASNGTLKALNRHWTSVFVTCATPIVGIWQRILLSARPGFLHQHAQQITRLDKLFWQYLVRHRR